MPAMNPTPETNLTPETNDAAVPRLRAAYLRRLEEINAVPDSALVPINISIPTAVTTVLGSLPKIRAMRDQLAGMPGFDLEAFDKLEDYTLAVAHAQARYAIACAPPSPCPSYPTAPQRSVPDCTPTSWLWRRVGSSAANPWRI